MARSWIAAGAVALALLGCGPRLAEVDAGTHAAEHEHGDEQAGGLEAAGHDDAGHDDAGHDDAGHDAAEPDSPDAHDAAEQPASSEVAGTTQERTDEAGFGARIVAEFDALLKIKPLALGAWLAFVLAFAWLFAWLGPATVRFAWRVGADPQRRLGLAASAMRITGLLLGIVGILRPVFMRAPTLGVLLMVIALALAAAIAPGQLRNLASGLSLSTRGRLREGDLVTVGEHEGIIRDIGLLRVGLRTSEGGLTHIPAADFDRYPVTVGSRRAASPVEVRTVAHPSFDEDDLEDLRRALWLCAYRRASTELLLGYDPQTGELEVRMDTWATLAVAEVERHLRSILLARAGTKATAPSHRRRA